MKCILVFDHLNDILFSKCDNKFLKHIYKLAGNQGVDFNDSQDADADMNFLIQLFSPIVTSQRVMSSQFGNSYRSIQCQDGINLVFDEYMGYLFVCLGFEEVNWLKRMCGVSISIIQHLCGPDVSILKVDEAKSLLVSRLIETWSSLVNKDQSVLVEALEQLTVNTELSNAAIAALNGVTEKLKSLYDYQKSHALIFVENKFLALFSSKNATELSSGDILFLSLLVEGLRGMEIPENLSRSTFKLFSSDNSSEDEFYSPDSSPEPVRKNGAKEEENFKENLLEVILLSENDVPGVVPHVIHVSTISPAVSLIILYQRCSEVLSVALNESLQAATVIAHSVTTDSVVIKRNMDRLDSALKKLFDNLKKLKPSQLSPKVDATSKLIHSKWDILKKLSKEGGIDGCIMNLVSLLKQLLHTSLFLDTYMVQRQQSELGVISSSVAVSLTDFNQFLQVKALTNFNLGSRASLSINKYMEEFPALVHFMYIDRTNHRITAPTIDFDCKKTVKITKRKIWLMVELSRSHLQEGHLSLMWKDHTFNYAYYLWFEDNTGTPLKPKVSPTVVVKSLPIPGVIGTDFYQKLVSGCFPKMASKVRCYELYTVHLGQVTSPLVLEHSRRLAATIWEVTGMPNNPMDLL